MLSCSLFGSAISITTATISAFPITIKATKFNNRRAFHKKVFAASVHYDSLRVLEWDKLCDSVASFASTSLGREATKAQLWSLNQTFEESLRLLDETNAAVEMHKHGGCRLNFGHIDVVLVKSAVQRARRSTPVNGYEAMAIIALLQSAEALWVNLKAAVKEDADWYSRFMPLTEVIRGFNINLSLVKLIQRVIDENGCVKDSASPTLKKSREQVRMLERKISQLMESLVRNERNETSILGMSNIDGRWCLKVDSGQMTSFKGLLLSSGSGSGSIIEPLCAVPLNDELQRARALVVKAETDVLLMLTEKMQTDLDDIEKLLSSVVRLDVISARATYSLSFGGTSPCVFMPGGDGSSAADACSIGNNNSTVLPSGSREWTLYLPKAYHPLLLQHYKESLDKARQDVKHATIVNMLEPSPPVPVDFFVAQNTRVLIITGPNTGGKTICLKTVGLAAMMAKSGLHVLASESVQIPWFDSVFADIGDEQSLSHSLSTFSGHLKQISDIQSQSTSQSLVLLDEVGAGTNPLEGAALGMSLLESLAQSGSLLTIATTHHGELKTMKYRNDAFENACMEYDEVNLKPTYKVLWGVPGRSNAINIAERLGLPSVVVDNARSLYGSASAEIDEVIIDMEKFKRDYQELLDEAHHYLMHSKGLYESLLDARRKIIEHSTNQRFRKMRDISEAASVARSVLHKKARQLRASAMQPSCPNAADKRNHISLANRQHTAKNSEPPIADRTASTLKDCQGTSSREI
ncbi:DNA mismatch repair MUTS family protein [Quillaja saponaria]|uniref:DNA mismatch repair MUTS family protein n=1 Tax=Quillaja saponaria TaxID=32244 RepID=A0AAD7LVP7_QUISA|nr:DNA mismatch repair MUTS family protein [Quillaja saponaria]